MGYFEHLVACKQAEDAAYKIEQAEKAKHDSRIADLEAETSRLKATVSDRESTIVSQQEELWRLRPRVKELELEMDCIKRERICDDCREKYDKKIAELEEENEKWEQALVGQSIMHSRTLGNMRDELRNLKAALEKTNSL